MCGGFGNGLFPTAQGFKICPFHLKTKWCSMTSGGFGNGLLLWLSNISTPAPSSSISNVIPGDQWTFARKCTWTNCIMMFDVQSFLEALGMGYFIQQTIDSRLFCRCTPAHPTTLHFILWITVLEPIPLELILHLVDKQETSPVPKASSYNNHQLVSWHCPS